VVPCFARIRRGGLDLQIPKARLVVAVLGAARLAQAIAGKVSVAPLAAEALRVDVGEAAALVVVLVGLQQAARAIGDAGDTSCRIISITPGFGLAAEVQSAFRDAPPSGVLSVAPQ